MEILGASQLKGPRLLPSCCQRERQGPKRGQDMPRATQEVDGSGAMSLAQQSGVAAPQGSFSFPGYTEKAGMGVGRGWD